jgi:hypothetical protein
MKDDPGERIEKEKREFSLAIPGQVLNGQTPNPALRHKS